MKTESSAHVKRPQMDGWTDGRMDGYSLVKINMKQIYKVRYYVDLS